jgi:hypothetical protein
VIDRPGSGLFGALLAMAGAGQQRQPERRRERRLRVDMLHGQPPGTACLIALTPAGSDFCFIGTPPAAALPPFAAGCQQEAAFQDQLERGLPMSPADLREQAAADVILGSLPPKERKRFEREEADLHGRLAAFGARSPDEQRRALAADPDFATEVRSADAVRTLPLSQQVAIRRQLLELFAAGRMAHFSYAAAGIAVPPPEPPHVRKAPEPPEAPPPADPQGKKRVPKRIGHRDSDVYLRREEKRRPD